MPTTPGSPSTPLTPQEAVAKFTGLVLVPEDESPAPEDTPAAPDTSPAPSPVSPPAPAEPAPETPEPDDTPSAERYTVQVDGQPVTVDLEELKAGYRYNAHNTQTAQRLAAERKAFETEAEAVQRERTQYQQGLRQLGDALQQLQGEPDWVKLRGELPPEDFLKKKADWEASKAHLDRLRQQEAAVAQKAQEEQAQAYAKHLRAEQDRLVQAVPEWQDAAKAKAEHAKLIQTAVQYGYTEDEVRQVSDHRAILLLRDAMRYRELHRAPAPATKAKVSPIKTAKPGTPERPRPNAAQEKLIERVGQTHRQRDAQAAIQSLLPDD